MRTLLIDNYDSFTYNLWHYLAELNGTAPVVIRNDDAHWRLSDLAGFDNVVISPGPGTPRRATDLGIGREVIEHADIPLLGVCLGHQAVAYAHGATVDLAPEPRHGRLSPVEHRRDGLFTGIPSPFQVVRYHSLAVTDLPEDLEATAWTPDGVLMALRHRRRPLWGLQFHPESICTQYGRQILANFRDLTREFFRARQAAEGSAARPYHLIRDGFRPPVAASAPATPASIPAPPAPAHAAATPGPSPAPPAPAHAAAMPDASPAPPSGPARPTLPAATAPVSGASDDPFVEAEVLVRPLPTRWDDEVVFDALFRSAEHAFWLDSSLVHEKAGRFSVMGDASGPLARRVSADVRRGTVTITSEGRTRTVERRFFDWLDDDLRRRRTRLPDLPFDFTLGWVGHLGYELKAECGAEDAHASPTPDANLIFADRAVVFDHATATTYLLALAVGGDQAAALDWFEETTARLRALAGRRPGPAGSPGRAGRVRLRHDRDRYLELIAACQEAIVQGETYEVCLTNMLHVSGEFDPWECYRAMRAISPATFGAYLRLGPVSVLSASPERFLRVSADGAVESKPIKGTRPRGRTPAEDTLIAKELATSEKDLSENLMIVDLVRNDLGRVAEVGSVHVAKIFDVETYATVHQLVSTVRARLRPDASAVECVRAAFPGGSMTGAPKIRTMRIIDELEAGPRGVYSGAIGFFSLSGAADLAMVIRTAVITPEGLAYGVGGAIVALSDPAAEYEETAVKAIPLLRALGIAFPGAESADGRPNRPAAQPIVSGSSA
ncbi:aminodeoxychorismate synthase component I [Thermopolyspora sp. NPDC052614]|uniref:aminodeoxychorismate synthase component I n=1 Tax=Thermopolyspora sp. NPDC052614 TaxID=3155682 RepID=UPI00343FF035